MEKELFPITISYKGKPLKYRYYNYDETGYVPLSVCFKIPAGKIKEKNPTLTFSGTVRGKDWKIDVRVTSFPSTKSNSTKKLTLTTLQKNYSLAHITEWILWHHRLHKINKILFYDNGSDNINEVKKAFKHLSIPNLEIIFIDWSYYYGGPSPVFDDLFAQNTQFNHTLKLHHGHNHCIASWDLDEYLINRSSKALKTLANAKPYLEFACCDVVDTEKKMPTNINECITRYRYKRTRPRQGSTEKYLYHSNAVEWINNPHAIQNTQLSFFYRFVIKIPILKNRFRREKFRVPSEEVYLVHAQPIKVIWKIKRTNADRPFKATFDPTIHVRDRNIQKSFKKAKLK